MGGEGTRYARHLPYQVRNSQSRKLVEMRLSEVKTRQILYHNAERHYGLRWIESID